MQEGFRMQCKVYKEGHPIAVSTKDKWLIALFTRLRLFKREETKMHLYVSMYLCMYEAQTNCNIDS
jgi:hypothetical protein